MPHLPVRLGSPAAIYARIIRALRYPVAGAWVVVTAAAFIFLPALSPAPGRSIYGAALGAKVPAIEAEITAVHDFAFPVLAQVMVVQHRPGGLSARAQLNTVVRATQLDAHKLAGAGGIAGAIPVTNAAGLFPGARQRGTTAITYLFFRPSVSLARQVRLARAYIGRYLSTPGSGTAQITGPAVAERAQGMNLRRALPVVELASILLVVMIVGGAFRSVLAPVIALAAAGMAYAVSQRILEQAAVHLGVVVPAELDPVIVVLLLGIMTDYSVFYLSGTRNQLRAGGPPGRASTQATQQVTPLVLTAGFTVAASVAVIQAARLPLFSELAPGLAITVAVGVLVAVTFIPAMLAITGRAAFWPSRPGRGRPSRRAGEPGGHQQPSEAQPRLAPGLRGTLARLSVRRPVAITVVLAGLAMLAAAALPLRGATVGVNLVAALPPSSAPARAAAAAGAGFAPGIVAPTEILLTAPGLTHRRRELDRLQSLIARQAGVAGVLGPADNFTDAEMGAFLSRRTGAARYVVILSHRPTGPAAISSLEALRASMPTLLKDTHLTAATASFAGSTALSASIVRASKSDLVRVALLTLAVDLVILAIFLRAALTPVVLVGASAVVVAASLGVTTWVFTRVLNEPGFTFYVPFAAEVLLISFGADYNLFLVGRIWEAGQQRPAAMLPPARAIARMTAETSRAINTAGLALALSFATLTLVDLGPFHQLALAMVTGLIIDTFFIRMFIVPSVLSLLGRAARWPRSGPG